MKNNLLYNLLGSMRPRQWSKNFFVLVAIIFAMKITDLPSVITILKAFTAFILASSFVYVINDIADVEKDKIHPHKKKRPIASGKLKIVNAEIFAFILLMIILYMSFAINTPFFMVICAYLLVQTAYSLFLKTIVIIDVFCIALGFVLRILAGALAIQVIISDWFFICAMMISLFLGFCKRRYELTLLGNKAAIHRPVLKKYSAIFLDQMIAVVTTATLLCYSFYTMAPETVAKFNTTKLIYSVPFVLYGIFRYLYLVYQKGQGGSPEGVVFGDMMMKINSLLYFGVVIGILYFFR